MENKTVFAVAGVAVLAILVFVFLTVEAPQQPPPTQPGASTTAAFSTTTLSISTSTTSSTTTSSTSTTSSSTSTSTSSTSTLPEAGRLRFVFIVHGDGRMEDGSRADFGKCISDSIEYIESHSSIRVEEVGYEIENAGYVVEEGRCSWLGGRDIVDQYPGFPEGIVQFLFWQNPPSPAPGVCYGGMCFNGWVEKASYRIPQPLAMIPYRVPRWWWGDCWLGPGKGCACGVTHEIHHVIEYELRMRGYPTSHSPSEHIHGKTVPHADKQSAFGFTDQGAFNDFMWEEITDEMVESLK